MTRQRRAWDHRGSPLLACKGCTLGQGSSPGPVASMGQAGQGIPPIVRQVDVCHHMHLPRSTLVTRPITHTRCWGCLRS